MKVAIIINGISRKKKFFYRAILPPLQRKCSVTVFETKHAQHAITLAAEARAAKFDYILAAGGDGTLNQVLNGVLQQSTNQAMPAIGIIPLGTGNDFAKMCGIAADGNQIAEMISKHTPKTTDIGKLECTNDQGERQAHYFINVCSIGMGPEVVKRLTKSNRSLGPLLTYLKAITQTFFSHRPQHVSARATGWEWSGNMRVLAIANGISFGNQMYIAPDAKPDDGVFSTFIAGQLPLLKFLIALQKVKGKKKVSDPHIFYHQCTTIDITAPEPCAIEAEGEWMGWLPMNVQIMPGQIKFLR